MDALSGVYFLVSIHLTVNPTGLMGVFCSHSDKLTIKLNVTAFLLTLNNMRSCILVPLTRLLIMQEYVQH